MQMSLGVLTAFASDMYYTKKSSSSVAAAVVCGTPLIGPRRLLDTYAYLNEVSSCSSFHDMMTLVLRMQQGRHALDVK